MMGHFHLLIVKLFYFARTLPSGLHNGISPVNTRSDLLLFFFILRNGVRPPTKYDQFENDVLITVKQNGSVWFVR